MSAEVILASIVLASVMVWAAIVGIVAFFVVSADR
jgi:hypothetical protein